MTRKKLCPLQWRHHGRDSVSNHQPHDCLLNRWFRRRSKRTPKLRVTGLCVGNSPVTGEFPAQMANNADNVSIWWHHHANDMLPAIRISPNHSEHIIMYFTSHNKFQVFWISLPTNLNQMRWFLPTHRRSSGMLALVYTTIWFISQHVVTLLIGIACGQHKGYRCCHMALGHLRPPVQDD